MHRATSAEAAADDHSYEVFVIGSKTTQTVGPGVAGPSDTLQKEE